jgi:hypothetical protein
MKHRRRTAVLTGICLVLEYVSLFFAYGEDLRVVPLMGLSAAAAGAAARQAAGKSARDFSVFAIIWWLVTILLTGDTFAAWGKQLLSGFLGGGVLFVCAFFLRILAGKYWKRHEQKGTFFTWTDCVLMALPGFYFGIAVGVFGFLMELLLALIAGNVRLDRRIPTGAAAFASCWVCALFGARFMTWYIGFF